MAKDYETILNEAEKARLDGVDIIALEEPEYTETLNCILDALEGVLFSSECVGCPRDAFRFNGVEFVKQE